MKNKCKDLLKHVYINGNTSYEEGIEFVQFWWVKVGIWCDHLGSSRRSYETFLLLLQLEEIVV